MEAEGDQVVVRANRHPHPAVTCLVRNLDCDQSMIRSTTILSLWRARRVWQEQAPVGGAQREGQTGGCGDSEHLAVDTESNVRTGSMYLLNGVCDVRACLPLVVTGGLTVVLCVIANQAFSKEGLVTAASKKHMVSLPKGGPGTQGRLRTTFRFVAKQLLFSLGVIVTRGDPSSTLETERQEDFKGSMGHKEGSRLAQVTQQLDYPDCL